MEPLHSLHPATWGGDLGPGGREPPEALEQVILPAGLAQFPSTEESVGRMVRRLPKNRN